MTTDERFDRIDDSIERLTRYVLEFREETSRRFQVIEQRLDFLASTVTNIDARFPPMTKAILDFGSVAVQVTRDTSDLAARVTRIEEKTSKLIDPPA